MIRASILLENFLILHQTTCALQFQKVDANLEGGASGRSVFEDGEYTSFIQQR